MSYPYGQGGQPGYPPMGGQQGFQMPTGGGYPPQPGNPTTGPSYPYPAYPSFPMPQAGGYPPNVGGGGYPAQPGVMPYVPPSSGYPPQQPMMDPGYAPNPNPYPGYPSASPYAPPSSGQQSYVPPTSGQQPYVPPGQQPYAPPQSCPRPTGTYPTQPYAPPALPPKSGNYRLPLGKSNMVTPYYEQGTVSDYHPFDAESDSQVLRKAMKGLGTDEKAIIEVLARRSNRQRIQILSTYKTLFGRDLIEDLKSELSGRFEDVILALMSPLPHFLARQLHKAVCGAGTNEDTLVEVLATRSNDEIRAINQAYHLLHNTTLEEDLVSDTSGNFRRLMVSLCSAGRAENAPIDHEKARHDAKLLLEAGEGQWGTDESTFNAIMAAQSFPQLRHVFYEYYQLTGRTIEQAISAEMSGDIKDGMLAIAKSVENRAGYFAEKLYKAMSGMGTDDCVLIRIVVSRSEIDLVQIKEMYEQTYGKSLAEAIADDTSGDYKRVLVALVGN